MAVVTSGGDKGRGQAQWQGSQVLAGREEGGPAMAMAVVGGGLPCGPCGQMWL